MTTKKDNPGKDRARSQATAGPKKPYATLNLKATAVNPKADESKKPGAASQGSLPAKTPTLNREAAPSGKGAPKPAPASDSKNPKDATPTPGAATGSTKPDNGKAMPAKKATRKSRSGIGGTISHLSAGALGGLIAFFGADAIAPSLQQFGIPVPGARVDTQKAIGQMERRLGVLETTTSGQGTTDTAALEAQINATEARLAELEALSGTVTALNERQAQLAAQASARESSPDQRAEVGAVAQRVADLEKQLSVIESSAGQDGGGSGLANLSVITGRLVDLETTLNNQMTALRESVGSDIEARFATVSEASEAAKSGTVRMDRQLATLTTDTARISQRLEVIKADADRLVQAMRVAREETGGTKSALAALEGDVKKTIAGLATHDDVETAVAAVSTQIEALRDNVGQVVQSEKERKANAKRIVLSLELGNLKRALDRGEPYSLEISKVRNASNGALDLSKLAAFESTGVPTLATLESSFRPVANAIIEAARAPAEGTLMDQLLAGARSIVRVRKINHKPDDLSAEAVVGRIEKALRAGQLDQVIKDAQVLEPKARAPAHDWLAQVEARRSVATALAEIEAKLKASLSGSGSAGDLPLPPTQAN